MRPVKPDHYKALNNIRAMPQYALFQEYLNSQIQEINGYLHSAADMQEVCRLQGKVAVIESLMEEIEASSKSIK